MIFSLFHLISEINPYYESSITVDCSADANPPANATWEYPDTANFQKSGNSIVFSSFNVSDEGKYNCTLRNNIEPFVRREFKLFGKASSAPKITRFDRNSIEVYEGDDLRFTCRCTLCMPIKKAFMYRIHESERIDVIIASNNNTYEYEMFARLENVSVENSGTYVCSLENNVGTTNYTFDVNVRPSPDVKKVNNLYQCNVSEYVDSIDFATSIPNLTLASKLYDCYSSDTPNSPIAVMLIGRA